MIFFFFLELRGPIDTDIFFERLTGLFDVRLIYSIVKWFFKITDAFLFARSSTEWLVIWLWLNLVAFLWNLTRFSAFTLRSYRCLANSGSYYLTSSYLPLATILLKSAFNPFLNTILLSIDALIEISWRWFSISFLYDPLFTDLTFAK